MQCEPRGYSKTRLRFAACALCLIAPVSSPGQISTDDSFAPGQNLAGPNFVIPSTLGQVVGTNLFHSFTTFNVQTGESASFTNPGSINVDNLISRVTGGGLSTIDGMIESKSGFPTANFFLINPSGLMFGPNATLDIGGSFYASTASKLVLAGGGQFNATNPLASVLTTAAPTAFGFLGAGTPAAITVDGSTLQVSATNTLALVGGKIVVDGAFLNSSRGNVDIAAVSGVGEARLGSVDVSSFNRLGDVTLNSTTIGRNSAGSFFRGGSVSVQGRHVLIDSPDINSIVFDPGDGGDIVVHGESVEIRDGGVIQTATFSSPPSGSIEVEAQTVTIHDSALLRTFAVAGSGSSGDIRIRSAGSVLIERATVDARSIAAGDAGGIAVTAKTLRLNQGALVRSSTLNTATGVFGTGDAGGVDVNVDRLMMTGFTATDTPFGSDSTAILSEAGDGNSGRINVRAANSQTMSNRARISTSSFGAGRGGAIDIKTGKLRLGSGASILASAFGSGSGGSVNVVADSVTLDGIHPQPFDNLTGDTVLARTAIAAQTTAGGDAGSIDISAARLVVSDGGFISTNTFGAGRGGEIKLEAANTTITGRNAFAFKFFQSQGLNKTDAGRSSRSGVSAGANDFLGAVPSGDSGSISVISDTLTVARRGLISSQNEGTGAGGEVDVRAITVSLSGGGEVSASSTNTGDAGSISLTATNLELLDAAQISTDAVLADGGNIDIEVDFLVFLQNSSITTSVGTGQGQGGNVTIDPVFVILDASRIQANAFGGPGGNITIIADNFIQSADSVVEASSRLNDDGVVEINSPDTDLSAELAVLPSSIQDPSSLFAERCSARRSHAAVTFSGASRGGLPVPPNGPLLTSFTPRRANLDQVAAIGRHPPLETGGLMNASLICDG